MGSDPPIFFEAVSMSFVSFAFSGEVKTCFCDDCCLIFLMIMTTMWYVAGERHGRVREKARIAVRFVALPNSTIFLTWNFVNFVFCVL